MPKNWPRKVFLHLLYVLPFLLIFSMLLSNIAVSLLAVEALYQFLSKKRVVTNWRHFLLAATAFIISVVGLLHTSTFGIGISIVETRLAVLLFPFIIIANQMTQEEKNEFARWYIVSLLATFFILLTIAVYRNILGPGPTSWFNMYYYHYSDLTSPIGIDPLYLSLFVGLGLLLSMKEFMHPNSKGFTFSRTAARVVLAILATFLVLLGVRSILMIIVLLILLNTAFNWGYIKKVHLVIPMLTLVLIASFTIISPVTRDRFKGLYNAQYEFSNYSIDRFIIWDTAIREIIKNPGNYLLGKGTGASEVVMASAYQEREIKWDFEKKTNTHNQYIEFILDNGILGAIFLFLSFSISLVIFYRRADYFGFIFIILMTLALFGENYLNRQKGVVFFSMMYSIAMFSEQKEKRSVKITTVKGE